jgi:hypothetical protein
MFKVLSNIPTWDTLFEASSASRTLHVFQLPNGWQDGDIRGLEVSTLTSFTDVAKPTARPQYLVLVVEPPYAVEAIRHALGDLAGDEMVDLVKAANLDAVGPQCGRLLQACRTVESRFLHAAPASPSNTPTKKPMKSKPTLLLAAFTLLAAGLVVQWFWLSRLIGSPSVSLSADLATVGTNILSVRASMESLNLQIQTIAGTQKEILQELQRLKLPPAGTEGLVTQVQAQLKSLADRVQSLTVTQAQWVTVLSGFPPSLGSQAAPTPTGQTNTASPPSSRVPPR